MKKVILMGVCLVSMLGVSATVLWEGDCGYKTYTVDDKWFEKPEDAEKYYKELNEIFCGDAEGKYIVHDLNEGGGN